MAKRIKLIIFLLSNSFFALAQVEAKQEAVLTPYTTYGAVVTKHGDGDTIKVKLLEFNEIVTVRLLSTDTPETHFQKYSQGEEGELAAARLVQLLPLGTNILVETDQKPKDDYGRILGYIKKNETDINLQMIREGMPLFFAPNLSRIETYRKAALQAQAEQAGVFWGAKDLQAPAEFRFEKSGRPEAPCVGNLQTGEVVAFSERNKIPLLDRVYFSNVYDIFGHFYLQDDCPL